MALRQYAVQTAGRVADCHEMSGGVPAQVAVSIYGAHQGVATGGAPGQNSLLVWAPAIRMQTSGVRGGHQHSCQVRAIVKEYYVRRGESVYGPLNARQLRAAVGSGRVVPEDEIARSRSGPWHPASQIPGLFSQVPADAVAQTAHPETDSAAATRTDPYAFAGAETASVTETAGRDSWEEVAGDYDSDALLNAEQPSFVERTAALPGEVAEELIPRARMPREIRELIAANETVLFADNPSRTVLVLRLILCNLISFPLVVAGVMVMFGIGADRNVLAGVLVLLGAFVSNYAICVAWKHTFYTITNMRLMARSGYFNRRIKIAPVGNIQEISINTGLIDRWLHLNTVHFATSASSFLRITGGTGVTFKSVQSRVVLRAFEQAVSSATRGTAGRAGSVSSRVMTSALWAKPPS